jgi:hypothetical protein
VLPWSARAPDTAIICTHAIRAIQWDQTVFVISTIALLRKFMSLWGRVTFNRHTACPTNCFGFYVRSYPPKLLRLLTIVGATSGREEGEVNISHPLCIMALFLLAFGWLVLCSILLVARHMTSWQSMEFQKHQ